MVQPSPQRGAPQSLPDELRTTMQNYETAIEALQMQQLVINRLENLLATKVQPAPFATDSATEMEPNAFTNSESIYQQVALLKVRIERVRRRRRVAQASHALHLQQLQTDMNELRGILAESAESPEKLDAAILAELQTREVLKINQGLPSHLNDPDGPLAHPTKPKDGTPSNPGLAIPEMLLAPEVEAIDTMEDTANQSQEKLRRRIARMYERYNPAKLPVLDTVLEKYDGKEAELLNALRDKYGAEPSAPTSHANSARGGSLSTSLRRQQTPMIPMSPGGVGSAGSPPMHSGATSPGGTGNFQGNGQQDNSSGNDLGGTLQVWDDQFNQLDAEYDEGGMDDDAYEERRLAILAQMPTEVRLARLDRAYNEGAFEKSEYEQRRVDILAAAKQ